MSRWTRSFVLLLATPSCVHCAGRGLRGKALDQPCGCVLRSIFRTVHRRFKAINEAGPFDTHNRMDATSSAINKPKSFTRRTQTFTADFCNVSKRFLSETEHRLFRYRFLLGADEKLCCRQLKMDPGAFNHEVYRIQQKLGKAFAELEPYPLFPLADYFGHSHAGGVKPCVPALVRRDAGPVRLPLAARIEAAPARVSALVTRAPLAPVINLAEHVRARFRSGASTRAIAADLTRLNVLAPNGARRWGQSDIRKLLLDKAA